MQELRFEFEDGMGRDAKLRVMEMVKDSGLPIEFWERFPEWRQPRFAYYFLGVYLRIKEWGNKK